MAVETAPKAPAKKAPAKAASEHTPMMQQHDYTIFKGL